METQSRLRSWPLWTSIFALVVFCAKMYFDYEIPGADQLVNLVLPIVVGLGIINNPSDSQKF